MTLTLTSLGPGEKERERERERERKRERERGALQVYLTITWHFENGAAFAPNPKEDWAGACDRFGFALGPRG